MKILIFSWRGPKHPHAGGAEIVTHEHAKAWVKAGHTVTLFTSDFAGGKKQEVIQGVNIVRQGDQILSVQIQAFFWYLFRNKQKFDLVIDQFHGLPFFTPLFVKVKKIAFIHEVTKEVWQYNPMSEPFHSLVSIIGKYGEPFVFKLFYSTIPFITVSDSTKNELIEIGIDTQNIKIIHNGISSPKKIKKVRKEENIVTFIGALAKDKGIEDAIKVFAELKKHNKLFKFWVIGKHDEAYFQILKLLSKKLDLEKNIKFWGYVSEQKKFELLGRSYIIINPSVREGWGLTVMEAGLVGTPTVGYQVSGLKDVIVHGKTGLLTSVNTPHELSKQVLYLVNHNKQYQKLSQQVRIWVSKFNWRVSTHKSLLFIKKVVKPLV